MRRSGVSAASALDTSVLVAALLSWHEHHEVAAAALSELLESQDDLILPLHALVEAYSVMTRLPPPHRLSARDAFEILDGSLRGRTRLIGLEGDEAWGLIEDLSRRLIAGGASYDALILASARKGGAHRILTLNRTHFERIAADDFEIVVPGAP